MKRISYTVEPEKALRMIRDMRHNMMCDAIYDDEQKKAVVMFPAQMDNIVRIKYKIV